MGMFRDKLGRKWSVTIDVGTIKRVREMAGFDLLAIVEDDGKPLEQLRDDVVLLVDVLYAIVEPQCAAYGPWWRRLLGIGHGITDEDFGRGLRGDCIERAWELIIGELAAFFPEGRRLLLLAAAIQANFNIQVSETTKRQILGVERPPTSGGSCSVWRALSACRPGRTPGASSR